MIALGPAPLAATLADEHVDAHRDLSCDDYDACLATAARDDWAGWTCAQCARFIARLAPREEARAEEEAPAPATAPERAAKSRSGERRRVPQPVSAPGAGHSVEDQRGHLLVTVQARSVPALFVEAARAAADVCGGADGEPSGDWAEEVAIAAPDEQALLGEWVRELVERSERAGARFTEHDIVYLSEQRLLASVRGTRFPDVRAPGHPACHEPVIRHGGDGLRATVMLDL